MISESRHSPGMLEDQPSIRVTGKWLATGFQPVAVSKKKEDLRTGNKCQVWNEIMCTQIDGPGKLRKRRVVTSLTGMEPQIWFQKLLFLVSGEHSADKFDMRVMASRRTWHVLLGYKSSLLRTSSKYLRAGINSSSTLQFWKMGKDKDEKFWRKIG